jgi:uncharacterized sulfatase
MCRQWIFAAALVLLACSAFGPAAWAAEDEDPPNVVMIISDDQTWTDFGFMGHPHIQTPHIDRLAERSRTFTRGYVPDSLCRPSLATLISGLYPHQHNIVGNDPPKPEGMNRREAQQSEVYKKRRAELISHVDSVPKLPEILNDEHGYLSHQSGKWWEGHYSRGGFTHGMTQGFGNHPRGRHGDEGLKIGREGMGPVFDFMDEAQERDRPFFVWYAPFLPHRPHNPPGRLLEKYKDKTESIHVARYWAMCEWFDETVGELMGDLDENGLAGDTLVLYVADNGWVQKPDDRGYALRSKGSPFEAGTRTPIMVRWPGVVEPEMDRETVVSSVDLAPTVLDAAGLEPSEEMPGVSLLDEEAVEAREAIFGEIFYHDIVSLDDPVESLKYRWCIEGRWKLILPYAENLPDEKVQLYDLKEDPHEQNNLASAKPDVVKRLRKRIEGWWSID